MTFAYWCILIACLLPLFCAAYAKKAGGFRFKDNHNPRGFLAHTQGAAARAHAAQQNGFEAFAPFAAAVLTAHATGNAGQATVNTLAGLFILFRLAFIWCYIADKAALRSLMWAGGFACTVGLFVAAA
ncbi:MAPEG family protein [Neisseria gonorrhoeae]|uniref:Membrane protein n=5 Tax=Pseudomonadota TaxID=1224 RepID=Q5F6S6_NEIG1|nr:MAPEG family protein [Neisseria gonorrhoeae]KLR99296.1 membrane protein [Neisseria gonorrhoeae SK708]KLR99516.1 membrane protein [Neisseria gonorrhoeae SK14515]KLS40378.1 membrane protein [Neisseria gonorrhoeae SK23020]AAW90111.1 membrane protein [Neisseria gonorrhoeae FA 1090]ACF30381.1 Membrane protein [Neisseria gonorrhoeae NCCP11945]